MKDFKQTPKMKSQLTYFREGGYVTKKELVAYEKKEDRAEEKKDIAEDKKIAKKAIAQHESAQHKGQSKTELKLKAGRRVKKEGGVVNKFKKGGAVDAAEKGKPSADKDPIKKVKAAPKKAATPSKAKTKRPEVPGKEAGPSASMVGMTVPAAGAPAPTAPSPAMAMPQDGISDAFAKGGWINEEPDDATAPVKKPIRKPKPKGFESEMMVEGYAPGGMIPDAVTRAGIGGLGNAINTGPLGAAGSMGAPRNTPLSPQEQDIMRGLQAVGSYCKGGKAY